MTKAAAALLVCGLLGACGGGGGGGGGGNRGPANVTTPPPAGSDFDQGIFRDAGLYKDVCLNPRTGNFPDTQGAAEDENDWLRAWSHDLYLWYDEIVDEDPAAFATPAYFDRMQTFATTPTGRPKDQFHFTYDTEEWQQLAQSGISAGYGAEFILLSNTPPREVIVALVAPGSPAAAPGVDLTRGTRVVEVDGASVSNGSPAVLNAGLFPEDGEMHTFVVQNFDGSNQRTVSMTSEQTAEDPVPTVASITTGSGDVGYLLFTSHLAPAEARLVDEINDFAAAGITDLVIDLRYNGGGYLDIANMLAFMIAGPSAASGRVFEELKFNDKHPTVNPVTGESLGPEIFHNVTQGYSLAAGDPLPTLNLPRVVVLSGQGTCSAGESVINGLRGIDVEVILIGDPTCGKPYGFYATDNCGTTYFSIQFRGTNAKGFGDYADGFIPTSNPVQPYHVTGCRVADDFSQPLGNAGEARLAEALHFLQQGECSGTASLTVSPGEKPVSLQQEGPMIANPRRLPGRVK